MTRHRPPAPAAAVAASALLSGSASVAILAGAAGIASVLSALAVCASAAWMLLQPSRGDWLRPRLGYGPSENAGLPPRDGFYQATIWNTKWWGWGRRVARTDCVTVLWHEGAWKRAQVDGFDTPSMLTVMGKRERRLWAHCAQPIGSGDKLMWGGELWAVHAATLISPLWESGEAPAAGVTITPIPDGYRRLPAPPEDV